MIARGETKENVLKRGWILESEVLGDQIIHPALVSDDPAEIGTVDVLVLACKSYSLKDVCDRYSISFGMIHWSFLCRMALWLPSRHRKHWEKVRLPMASFTACLKL